MSEPVLALICTVALLAGLFAWVPLLHSAEALAHRFPLRDVAEMPDLVEEDSSPQFTGEVA